MAATQRQEQNGKKKLNFSGDFDFDVEKMPIALKAGKFDFIIDKIDVKTTQKGDPYLNLKFKVEKADSEDNEDQEGKPIWERLIFYKDPEAPGAGINKRNMRQLCEQCEVELDEIPKRINQETLEAFAEVLLEKTFTAWVIHRENNGEVRAEVRYVEPSDGGLSLSGDGGDDEDETPKKPAKSAKKTTSRR